MGLRPADLAGMSLGEIDDQVRAWNAAQSDRPADLEDDEMEALWAWVGAAEVAGHA